MKGAEARVPDVEHKAFCRLPPPPAGAKRCKYYNLSCGCVVDNCHFKHVCWTCGKNHKWVDQHFR